MSLMHQLENKTEILNSYTENTLTAPTLRSVKHLKPLHLKTVSALSIPTLSTTNNRTLATKPNLFHGEATTMQKKAVREMNYSEISRSLIS